MSRYRSRRRRVAVDAVAGVILITGSIAILVLMLAGAAFCDFDPNAVRGQCLQSIYNQVVLD